MIYVLIIVTLAMAATTFGLEMYNELKMLKNISDKGYKVNLDEVTDINEIVIPNMPKARIIYMLIPMVNLYQVSKRISAFNKNGLSNLGNLDESLYLEKLSDAEKEYYKERPNGLRALNIIKKTEEMINRSSMHVSEKDRNSKIYFVVENGKFKLVRTTGIYSRITQEDIDTLLCSNSSEAIKQETVEKQRKYYEIDKIEEKIRSVDEDFSYKLKK